MNGTDREQHSKRALGLAVHFALQTARSYLDGERGTGPNAYAIAIAVEYLPDGQLILAAELDEQMQRTQGKDLLAAQILGAAVGKFLEDYPDQLDVIQAIVRMATDRRQDEA